MGLDDNGCGSSDQPMLASGCGEKKFPHFATSHAKLPHRSTPMRLEGFGTPYPPRTERVHRHQPTCALGRFWKLMLGNVRTFPRRAHIHIYMYGNPGTPEKHSKCMDLAFPS